MGIVTSIFAPESARQPDREMETGLLTRAVNVGKTSYRYQVYVPSSMRNSRNAPVLLFLHGIGQRGEGGLVPSAGGQIGFVKFYLEQLQAIVVLPQCRKDQYWHDAELEKMTIAVLDQTVAEFGGDPQRLYLLGVSMGGYGAWHMAAQYPGKFAAVVPICGGSPLRSADRFDAIARKVRQTPVWVFHGAEDRVVPVSESRNMVAALKAVNGNVRYNEYPGVGHNVWLNVLGERELLPWMLNQRLKRDDR